VLLHEKLHRLLQRIRNRHLHKSVSFFIDAKLEEVDISCFSDQCRTSLDGWEAYILFLMELMPNLPFSWFVSHAHYVRNYYIHKGNIKYWTLISNGVKIPGLM